ncbi:ECF-type sigma factor [Solimonas marina]|uniref:Sigma-70 family RNA polymerase sigma factor n=1 Tax=Solimonas marina TaxID=2714601 RepID=A0A970BAT8_9GAMM|nr:ECF-type sigma factor [Solimonas marina]NKF23721.1 sigma-70 family RNA polymerase sigma factor [Solimonas marina]
MEAPIPDAGADTLISELYRDLRRIAHAERLRVGQPMTLQTTALIHESYFKLQRAGGWQDRQHFLRTAAAAMRQILIDGARARTAAKRGAGEAALPLEFAEALLDIPDETLIRLGEALEELDRVDPRLSQIVECRFFAGYSETETAEIMGSSERTVRRDWTRARAWLYREIGES